MKRKTLAIIFACCTLALMAQDVIKVNYKGTKPTISDLAWAYLSDYVYDKDGDDCLNEPRNAAKQTWMRHRKGLPLNENETLTIDEKNGFVVIEYKSTYESNEDVLRIEMCYWNEADGKHKLFAYNVACFRNGKYDPAQFDGIQFYRYNNAKKRMTYCDAPGFQVEYGREDGSQISHVSHSLPRTGKDITVTVWHDNGKTTKETLKWNGHKFRK